MWRFTPIKVSILVTAEAPLRFKNSNILLHKNVALTDQKYRYSTRKVQIFYLFLS